jgi:hypothetical protein
VPLVLRTAGRGTCLVGLDGTVRTRRGRREEEFDDLDLDGVDGEAPAARTVITSFLGGFAAAQDENRNLPESISSDMLLLLPARSGPPGPSRRRRTRSHSSAAGTVWGGGSRARERASQLTESPTRGSAQQVHESSVAS